MGENLLFQKRIGKISLIVLCWVLFGLFADSANTDENNPHSQINCITCHTLNKKIDIGRDKCLTCHTAIPENSYLEAVGFHQDNSRQCTDCHSFHETEYLHVDSVKFQFDYDSESSKATCFGCHISGGSLGNLSVGHQEASKLYHSDIVEENSLSPSQTCMVCHSTTHSDISFEFEFSIIPVINNHSSHPYEIEVVGGQGDSDSRIKNEINPEIHLFDNKIECQTCHTLTTIDEYLLVSSGNQSILCSGCHEHEGNRIDLVSTP